MLGKIILGILTKEVERIDLPIKLLEEIWGEEEMRSEVIPFDFTDYYEKEMGKNLSRLWVSFLRPFPAEAMRDLKLQSLAVEKKFQNPLGGRQFNLDPGLLTLSNLCLLTHKNYAHRIYLGAGIFCEVTLLYKNKTFEKLPWTYPDYSSAVAINFFQEVRQRLLRKSR